MEEMRKTGLGESGKEAVDMLSLKEDEGTCKTDAKPHPGIGRSKINPHLPVRVGLQCLFWQFIQPSSSFPFHMAVGRQQRMPGGEPTEEAIDEGEMPCDLRATASLPGGRSRKLPLAHISSLPNGADPNPQVARPSAAVTTPRLSSLSIMASNHIIRVALQYGSNQRSPSMDFVSGQDVSPLRSRTGPFRLPELQTIRITSNLVTEFRYNLQGVFCNPISAQAGVRCPIQCPTTGAYTSSS